MTDKTPDDKPTRPNDDATPAPATPPGPTPGRVLVAIRLGLVVALGAGVLVFGFLAVRDLSTGIATPRSTPQPETLALAPGSPASAPRNPLASRSADDWMSQEYVAIDHDPAHLPPYPGARRDFCKRLANGEQYGDEQARYISVEATVDQVLAHYQRAAADAGFTPRGDPQPLQADPGGRQQVFHKGDSVLAVTVMSPTTAPPLPPPAAPPRPMLSMTVQFRYPIRSAP